MATSKTGNAAFRGATKRDLAHLSETLRELRDEVRELGRRNEAEHREIFVKLSGMAVPRIPWKFWGAVVASLITAGAAVLVALR